MNSFNLIWDCCKSNETGKHHLPDCLNFTQERYLFKVNNTNTRKRCEISSNLTRKTPEPCHWSSAIIINFEHISHLCLMFVLLTLSMDSFSPSHMCYLLNCYHHTITKESITKDPGPGPWKTWTHPEKPGPWKTWTLKHWTLKNLDPENLDNKKRGKQLDVEKWLEDYTV